ncbi:osteopontin precursor [Reticulomyxa filosa]|uniref:Osteopontin n=1 Tax=Reticulomyxa filosa TaxID=46433 RepID=X6PAL0_RETFI|nr:osteopontin precursor [Reticulomyxa filosa]|eukprot:ETO35191.1 osteopontin precursor [Reticulomyxa filosa]
MQCLCQTKIFFTTITITITIITKYTQSMDKQIMKWSCYIPQVDDIMSSEQAQSRTKRVDQMQIDYTDDDDDSDEDDSNEDNSDENDSDEKRESKTNQWKDDYRTPLMIMNDINPLNGDDIAETRRILTNPMSHSKLSDMEKISTNQRFFSSERDFTIAPSVFSAALSPYPFSKQDNIHTAYKSSKLNGGQFNDANFPANDSKLCNGLFVLSMTQIIKSDPYMHKLLKMTPDLDKGNKFDSWNRLPCYVFFWLLHFYIFLFNKTCLFVLNYNSFQYSAWR